MDGVSVAASIVGIATAGVQISIKLVTLATQISTASDRVSSIGNDISLTSGVLHQLGELMSQRTTDDGISIFSHGGLEGTRTSAAMCERIFHEVEREAKKASEQLRDCKQGRLTGGKIKLSRAEKAKWPFLQPRIDTLRADLRDAKGTLMLMLQVTSLALSKRMADQNASASSSMSEQRDFVRAIIALRQEQRQAQSLELRDKNPGGFHPSQRKVVGTSDSPRAGTADRTGSVDVFSRFNNPPVPVHGSQTQFTHGRAGRSLNGPTDFAPVMSTPQEMTMDFPTLPGQDRSLDVNICSVSSESFEVPKVPTHTENNGNLHNSSDDPFFVRTSSRSASGRHGNDISAKNLDPELKLFLLKPIVKDFFDKVELSWSVQNTETQALAIRRYMANHEQEGLPSVIEMLHDLHAYEQAMVDSEMSKYPEGAVLSLRRTKTDIQHRDMVFKAVPGLQFVVQHVRRTLPRFLRLDPGYLGASGAKPPENGALAPQITEPHTATPVASSQTSSQLPSDVFGDPICAVAPGYDLTKVYNTSDVRSQTMDSSPWKSISSSPARYDYHSERGSVVPSSMAPVAIETAKEPQCWDHGCNGRQFNTFGDLLRHQRESSNTPRKHTCHQCDAEFTRKTARDDHLAHDNCKRQLSSESLVAPQGDANVRRTRPEPRYSMTPEMQNCYASSLPQQPQFNLLPPYTYCPPAPPAVPCGNPQQAYGPVPGTQPDAAMSIQPNLEGAFQQPQQEAFEALRPSRVRAFRKKPRLAPKPKPKDDLPTAANQQAIPPITVLHGAQATASGNITWSKMSTAQPRARMIFAEDSSETDDSDEESDLDLIGHEGGDEDVDAVVTELLERYTTLFV